MQIFIVIGMEQELTNKIEEVYKDHYYLINGTAWAIAATNKTPGEIASSLGISAEGRVGGIVVQADSYNGWYNMELWEKCRLWEQSDG